MIQYFRNSAMTLAVVALMSSCVDTDNTFGNELIPPEWGLETTVDSTIFPLTYIVSTDSVVNINDGMDRSQRTGVMPVGSMIDPVVGRQSAQVFTNFKPGASFRTSGKYFGVNPVVDSMFVQLALSTYVGDTTAGINFELYEVTSGKFNYLTKYQTSYNIAPQIANTPLTTFTLRSPENKRIQLPNNYAQKFLINTQDNSNPYHHDTLFHKQFKGLYLKTSDVTTGQGCLYGFDLENSEMVLYYHNDDSDSVVTYVAFSMLDLSTYTNSTPYNTSFTMTQHDYTYADPTKNGVVVSQINDTINQSARGYIQGMGGLATYVEVPEAQIAALKAKVIAAGYSRIAIHAAEMIFYVSDPSTENYKEIFSAIAPYKSISKQAFIRDYNPFYSQFVSQLDGTLNRTKGQYKLNITSYMQERYDGKTTTTKLELAAPMAQILLPSRTVVMGSTSTKPPQIVLTYTMIK